MMRIFISVLALWIAINAKFVNANYLFNMHLNSFHDPTNTVANGSCCETTTDDSCTTDSCNIGLRICLRPAGFEHSDHSCPLLEIYRDSQPRIGQWAFSGAWPGSIQLYIRSTHTVGNQDTGQNLLDDILIDNIFIEIENLTSFSPLTPEEVFMGDGGRVVAALQFQVVCENPCFGEFCNVICFGRDDDGGHYRCNRDGDWECLEGYQNPGTNCTECAPREGCVNGYCDSPLSCHCLDGWNGDLCTECVPSTGCSPIGGYCETAGECLCRNGYSGDNCDIIAVTTLFALQVTSTIAPPSTNSPASTITSAFAPASTIAPAFAPTSTNSPASTITSAFAPASTIAPAFAPTSTNAPASTIAPASTNTPASTIAPALTNAPASTIALVSTIAPTSTNAQASTIGTLAVKDVLTAPSITLSTSPDHSVTSYTSAIQLTVTTAGGVGLLPTVGGVVPQPNSIPRNSYGISLVLIVLSAVGGLLLLLMIVLCVAAFLTMAVKRRKRTYEIATAGMTCRNDSLRIYGENRLLESVASTSSDMTENNTSFMTFTNGSIVTQPLRHELHVYYHRNTPEPPQPRDTNRETDVASNGGQEVTGDVGDHENDHESEEVETEKVELEFPSSFLEEGDEHTLQWSSLKSEKRSHLNLMEEEEDNEEHSAGHNTTLNQYQLY